MSCGKYSPTVAGWYARDQSWHDRHCEDGSIHDRDGYDSYGYHRDTGKDRAGYTEWDYLGDGRYIESWGEYSYPLYEDVSSDWAGKPFPWEKTG